ncbi:hypothetical protein [Streptomyces sp. cmx-18-6]|uniref:hypothetical protein n=1 Tax=Streptomyces sp. cmx-18-6 TaxID=2790930 RepID=UPI00397F9376
MSKVTQHLDPTAIPPDLAALGAMDTPDYADAFTLTGHPRTGHSAEEWARTMFEDVIGVRAQLLWRVVMGLRLRPRWRRRPGQVAGWPVGDRGPGWIRMEARSRAYTFHLVVRTADEAGDPATSLGTFVRYHTARGRRRWTKYSAEHRELAPGLLRSAADTLARTP